jgi:hypothetical protein
LGEEYRSWSSSLWRFLNSPVTLSLLMTQAHLYFLGGDRIFCI